ncbi:unnamed protein product [Meganyctiphanes norvegica]|uniref:WAP domain-containing protein n=1 Tax=Meganyctiphanes norvegica TaxID=48144 RepID=A0AAV2R3F5_MEGNR
MRGFTFVYMFAIMALAAGKPHKADNGHVGGISEHVHIGSCPADVCKVANASMSCANDGDCEGGFKCCTCEEADSCVPAVMSHTHGGSTHSHSDGGSKHSHSSGSANIVHSHGGSSHSHSGGSDKHEHQPSGEPTFYQ